MMAQVDAQLIARLDEARRADRERLLELEPRCRTREFIESILERLNEDPRLVPVAHDVLRFALRHDHTLLKTYLRVALAQVQQLHEAGELDQAIDVLEQIEQSGVQFDDKFVLFTAKKARVLVLLDHSEAALVVRAAGALVSVLPDGEVAAYPDEFRMDISTLLERAAYRAYYDAHDAAAVIRLGEAAHRVHSSPAGLHLSALALATSGEFEGARQHFRELVRHGFETAAVQYNLAQCELKVGDAQAAIACLRRACDLSPDSGTYHLSAATTFARLGKIDDAEIMLAEAIPLIERTVRDDPDRALATSSGTRFPLKDALALARNTIATEAMRHRRPEVAKRQLDELIATGDEVDVARARALKSQLALAEGDVTGARQFLDEAVKASPRLAVARLARAEFLISRSEYDRACEDLGFVIRNCDDPHVTLVQLERIIAVERDHQEALKWLGCALSFSDRDELDRARSLLSKVLERDPSDAYARLRRALAGISTRTDRSPEQAFTWRGLAEAVADAGIAAELAPDDAEIQRAFRWLWDRTSADPRFFGWLLQSRSEPGGIERVMRSAWEAIKMVLDAGRLADEKNHRPAVEQLRMAQSVLRREGLPAFASRVDLYIADNLLRVDDVQGAIEHLERFDRDYDRIALRPFSRMLDATYDNFARDDNSRLYQTRSFELEFMNLQIMGREHVRQLRDALMAQAQDRSGDRRRAIANIEKFEEQVLATLTPTSEQLRQAASTIQMLRDAGELSRARRLLNHVQPHAFGKFVGALEFASATLLTFEGKREEAASVFEAVLTRPALSHEERMIASVNLAGLIEESDPARALQLLTPLLSDASLTPRKAIAAKLLAAKAAYATGDHERAAEFAEEVVSLIVSMRETWTSSDMRASLVGVYVGHVETALTILVACQRAEAVLRTVESLRARGLADDMDARSNPPEEVIGARRELSRLRRIHAALSKLTLGAHRFGSGYADAEALQRLHEEDRTLDVFEDGPNRDRLSIEKLARSLHVAQSRIQTARAELDRVRLTRGISSSTAFNSGALRAALLAATPRGERSLFVSIVTTSEKVALVFLSTDEREFWIRTTEVPSESVRELGATPSLEERIQEPAIHATFQQLISPILEDSAPGDIIVLGVAGSCSRVPFHAISVGSEPWCKRNPICYAPSASVLARCVSLPLGKGPAVVVGDPNGDLPKARDEARAVATLLGVSSLLGGEATTDAVLATLSGTAPKHVHFACHGVADRADGMRSALRLSPSDATDEGLLTAEVLADTNLVGARTVVSACDTGINEERSDAESFGFARALLAAGARSVMASLWEAGDTATYLLMREYYRRLPDHGAVRALAGAQVWLRTLSVGDIVRSYDEALAAEKDPATRARVFMDRAGVELHANDFAAAKRTYELVVTETPADVAAVEVARAKDALRLLALRGDLPSTPDYERRPFEEIRSWAPFVLIGDWR